MINGDIWEAYKPPFSCDSETANVLDSEGNIIVTVRGWSHLCKIFEGKYAYKLQVDIANFIASKLNELPSPKE